MEILFKADTCINETVKKIEVSDVEFQLDTPVLITLEDLKMKRVYEGVMVDVKIQKQLSKKQGKKQDVLVGDHSDTSNVTLW